VNLGAVFLVAGLFVLLGWMGWMVFREATGQGKYARQYIDHPAGRVLNTSPLELGLTYEEVGERPPGVPSK